MYEKQSFSDKLRSFDIYGKLPSNYLKPTLIGALLTVVTFGISIYLFLFEFSKYFQVTSSSKLLIDTSEGSNRLQINIDITMHRLPCSILSLDISDFTGHHTSNVKGTLQKTRLDQNGKIIEKNSEKMGEDKEHEVIQPNREELKKALKDKEGCRLEGSISVLRLPGNFHVSSHAFYNIIKEFRANGTNINFDITHTVNHISFGEEKDIEMIKKEFNDGIITPLDNVKGDDTGDRRLFEYYLKIVPTEYVNLEGNKYNVFQFNAVQNKVESNMIPTLFFRYDISPIKVKFEKNNPQNFDGLINICAIIGGMFTIAGILDTLLLRLFNKNSSKKE